MHAATIPCSPSPSRIEGVGIPEEYQQAVFDRFESRTQRVAPSRRRARPLHREEPRRAAWRRRSRSPQSPGKGTRVSGAPAAHAAAGAGGLMPRRYRIKPRRMSATWSLEDVDLVGSTSRQPPRSDPEARRRDRAERTARRRQDDIRPRIPIASWRRCGRGAEPDLLAGAAYETDRAFRCPLRFLSAGAAISPSSGSTMLLPRAR